MVDDFEGILELQRRWPKAGDRLIQHAAKATDTYVSQESYERAMLIWRGYFRSGKLLARECEQRPFEINYLVYPMMFNYRHALEVAMKEIILEYGHHVNVCLGEDKSHNLFELWKTYLQLSGALNPQGGDETDGAVGRVVQDFHILDKSAVAFRYSTNKDGASFNFASGVVTIARLKEVMDGCANYFDCSDDYYHALTQNSP